MIGNTVIFGLLQTSIIEENVQFTCVTCYIFNYLMLPSPFTIYLPQYIELIQIRLYVYVFE